MLAVGGGAIPVRGPWGGAGFCGPPDFLRDAAEGEAFCFGEDPYFSSNSCVELYLVAALSLSIVASRSLLRPSR
jgi:hypothetical protein